jgi:hypothetical protein
MTSTTPHHQPTAPAALPPEQATILARLAGLLASLPATKIWGADELSATRHELETLSACLESWSTDSILRHDLHAIIKSLPPAVVKLDEGQDSGCDVMNCESSSDGVLLEGEWPALKTKLKEMGPCASQEPRRPFSWELGSEVTSPKDPWDRQSPAPHFRDSSRATKLGRQVELFVAGKDPPGGGAANGKREDERPAE